MTINWKTSLGEYQCEIQWENNTLLRKNVCDINTTHILSLKRSQDQAATASFGNALNHFAFTRYLRSWLSDLSVPGESQQVWSLSPEMLFPYIWGGGHESALIKKHASSFMCRGPRQIVFGNHWVEWAQEWEFQVEWWPLSSRAWKKLKQREKFRSKCINHLNCKPLTFKQIWIRHALWNSGHG